MMTIKTGLRLIDSHMTVPLQIDLCSNCHWVICGDSGSGKSYFLRELFDPLLDYQNELDIYVMDFKNSGDYSFMDDDHLAVGVECISMLNRFYERYKEIKEHNLEKRIICVFDEYAAYLTFLHGYDKSLEKRSADQVSEILMMGRRLGSSKHGGGAYFWCVVQRPDAAYFQTARDNFMVKIIMRDVTRSIRTMFEIEKEDIPPEHIAKTGHGIVLMGDTIYPIVVPTYDPDLMYAMLADKRRRYLSSI